MLYAFGVFEITMQTIFDQSRSRHVQTRKHNFRYLHSLYGPTDLTVLRNKPKKEKKKAETQLFMVTVMRTARNAAAACSVNPPDTIRNTVFYPKV